ncbi:hypothetical protein JCGZ_00299 [Jatropha curcas]|uniref:Glutaredoxin domain-containing protein n=1 Tax=Jatropha curcas TaxID=180498 RepID=A0A067L240_JATCU|nr:hypothetical protein JCGZ_00299 [Jatropha curcas]
MGCVSSKHFRKELKEDNIIVNNGGGGGKCVNHVVSLTSTTYGALKLESNEKRQQQHQEEEEEPIKEIVTESKKMQQRSPVKEEPEVINTWELMEDLEEGGGIPISNHSKKSPKTRVLLRGFADMEARSPLKFLNQIGSPRKAKTFGGKENKNVKELESILNTFEKKCPPGGDNAVVIYTTTLRGIRKTFEDCNIVRSIIESHHIHLVERDISMDSGFKEELRGLMGKKEVKVPLVFVKGRLIGGADQVVKLDEEGKLETLFHGIPKRLAGECEGCGGVRFVMCMECNGSCKVLDVEQKKMVKCGECNENGLIHCPICC